jgi:small-conductance mechanosensitive channel
VRASLRTCLSAAAALVALATSAAAQPAPSAPAGAHSSELPGALSPSVLAAPLASPSSAVAAPPASASARALVASTAPSAITSTGSDATSTVSSVPSAPPPETSTVAPPEARPASSAAPAISVAAPARLRDQRVFDVRAPRAGRSAAERAESATLALRRVSDDGTATEVHVEAEGDTASVFAGKQLIIELGPDDAAAAGEASVIAVAAEVRGHVREALEKEQSRSATVFTLLAFALVVLCAVLGLFLILRVGDVTDRTRAWIRKHPERLPVIKIQSIEVIRPESLRSALSVGLSAGKALAQLGIVYGWILITLSFFEGTHRYTERLNGFVFGPLTTIVTRLVGSLPLLVVAAIAAIAMVVLIRFVSLFFDGIARGETTVDWLPADLAAPTSTLVRAAIVLVFFVIAAPLVSGEDGALARAGTVAVVALGLSATPLLACVAVGVTVVYGRGLRVGDFAEVGGRSGRVSAITLIDVRIEDEHRSEIRVPHLLELVHPTRVLGPYQTVSVEVLLAPKAAVDDQVTDLLREAAGGVGQSPRVEVTSLDASGARYRVTVRSDALDAKTRLFSIVAQALTVAEIPLGRT